MGLFFTLLYIFGALFSPDVIYGELALYHIQILIAVLAFTAGLLQSGNSGVFKLPQTFALAGLVATVVFSLVFNGFFGASISSLIVFLPNAMAFFYIALNVRKKQHLQLVVVVALAVAFYVIVSGALALRAQNFTSPFLISEDVDSSLPIYRLRGLAVINDPNDLAQFLVALVPLTFFFWKKGRVPLNLLLVYVPIAVLIYGLFLTHSRGAMVALLACCLMAGRRKIGILPSAVISALMFAGLKALNWSGGRDISASQGSDRMEAWSTGLQLLRSHPVFGVGFNRFTEFYYITAHNTIVVCAAELGLVGLFFWLFFVYPAVADSYAGSMSGVPRTQKKAVPDLPEGLARPALTLANAALAGGSGSSVAGLKLEWSAAGTAPWQQAAPAARTSSRAQAMPWEIAESSDADEREAEDAETRQAKDAELKRLASLMLISLTGFLAAGWFLSRAFQMILFILTGMAAALAIMARRRGLIAPPETMSKTARTAALLTVVMVMIVYVFLRLDHLLPK